MDELNGPDLLAYISKVVAEAHVGQVDGIGAPYHGHLERVSGRAEKLRSEYARGLDSYKVAAVALAHDLLEDTPVDGQVLLDAGVGADVVAAIQVLTHQPGQSRQEYLERVLLNDVAVLVKLADTLDNGDTQRLSQIVDESRQARLADKYEHARKILEKQLRGSP